MTDSSQPTKTGTVAKRRMKSWWPHRLRVKDRRSIIDDLMVAPSASTTWRFGVLMSLSSMIAAIGLLQNSAAVVIGAMMIAPLMRPIMGVAACLIMGWGRRLTRELAMVSVAAAGAVVVGWIFAALLPATGTGLPAEVVARSSPDIRDLLIALGAGAAGAFATVHKEISVALPGVAVAVAVVPPLAAVGVLLGRGQLELARGAALLFVTNLVGILLMAAVVFLLSGLVPRRTFRDQGPRILVSLAVAAMCALAVAVILIPRFVALTGHARELQIATQTITNMLSPGSSLSHITTSDGTVRAEIIGPTAPPPVQNVAASLSRALGHPVTVQLGWVPLKDPEQSRPQPPPPPLTELAPVVDSWLSAQDLTLQGLSYANGTLVVATAGAHPPKSSDDLAAIIEKRFGHRTPVSLGWTRTPEHTGPTNDATALAAAQATAAAWASSKEGIGVLSVTGTARFISVTLIGHAKPDVGSLESDLRTALPQATITIQWVSGGPLVSATPTPTSPPASVSTPTTPPR